MAKTTTAWSIATTTTSFGIIINSNNATHICTRTTFHSFEQVKKLPSLFANAIRIK